jgi:hypothetical protein
MSRNDKLMLWGAAAVMIAVGALSLWKVSRIPAIDPQIAALKIEHEKLMNGPAHLLRPETVPTVHLGFLDVVAQAKPSTDYAGTIRTMLVGIPVPRPTVPVYILSIPVPKTATSTLDATTITWSLVEPDVKLAYWMKRNEIKPTGFILKRQCEDGSVDQIAEVDGKTFSYTDLTLKPRLTYRYWVVAKGMESDLELEKYPHPKKTVLKGVEESVQTRTPSDTRAKLVGGDKEAFFRIDTYDRASKKWIGKTAMAAPGQKVAGSGWTLKGLRFDNFTLVADVTDDEGVDRVLTTRN